MYQIDPRQKRLSMMMGCSTMMKILEAIVFYTNCDGVGSRKQSTTDLVETEVIIPGNYPLCSAQHS
jgi:hypothetical protein